MKLISFNIGIKIDNAKAVGEFILKQKPDIVAFQEIINHKEDAVFPIYRSKAVIEEILKNDLPCSFFGPQWFAHADIKNGKVHRDFGGVIEQGNEIMSKFPISKAVNEHYHKNYGDSSDRTNFHSEDHARSVVIAQLDINGQPLRIMTLHGAYSTDKKDTERSINQSHYLLKAAARNNMPTMIVGDLNVTPETKSIKLLEEKFRNVGKEYKVTSTLPSLDHGTETTKQGVLDYIFVDDQIKVNDFKVLETDISDHLPLLVDFEIK